MNRRRLLLHSFLVAIIASLACDSRPTPSPSLGPVQAYVSASELVEAYDQNIVAADYKYTDKVIGVSGEVINIQRYADNIHVQLEAKSPRSEYSHTYITCVFDNSQFQDVIALRKGQPAVIKGTCLGRVWGETIVLKNCVTSGPNGAPSPKANPSQMGLLPPARLPAPAQSHPVGASAVCRDGTYSFSANRRGTCSHHGGVAEWL